ncbi:extracellular matrix protein FRAS1 isoform X2 [Oreochromis niloticus]|uniref:extracellular matrix protein FRAS1 isoform X2 n=1 Tax=Oreochromis niloticus TaxID=8128 RepID=UPI000905722F|nr:extracellular matrix protein FRAS1 isoform X2 [Oreochromis niloticus]XP_025755262.1 extracellular matrix protein FRAS1 isoform X2 [Oreochromis niloticus]
MRVQEGVRKTITEFELKATDADTEAESIVFSVIQAPRHGTINGQHYRQISSLTMDDIDQNRISYNHDGSNSLKYRFTFTVTDSTNLLFMVEDNGKEKLGAFEKGGHLRKQRVKIFLQRTCLEGQDISVAKFCLFSSSCKL